MKKIIYLIVLSIVFTLQTISAQTRKNKKKIPTVRAIVTIRSGDAIPPQKRLSEEDENIWNEYASEKYKFRITFPAKPADVINDEHETGETFASFETNTKKAVYRLAIKSLNVNLDNSQLDELYESSFAGNLNSSQVKLISKKNVFLNRKLGKEFIYKENGRIYFQRFFIQEKRLFWLSVNLPEKQYTKDFNVWAMRFLESFDIETKDNLVGFNF